VLVMSAEAHVVRMQDGPAPNLQLVGCAAAPTGGTILVWRDLFVDGSPRLQQLHLRQRMIYP
jgi:hypothetical protein